MMRKGLLLVVLCVFAVLGGLVYLFSTLIALLFETGLANAIPPSILTSSRTSSMMSEEQRPIPKIIHQTWKNETIPEAWSIAQYTCRDLHPDYQYIVIPSPSL
jgi:hypothetical protein